VHISREKEEKRKKGTLRHERYEEIVRCFTRDGGRSCETGRQVQVSNYLKLLWAKAMVVSVEEKAYWIGQVWITKVSAKRTNVRIESFRRCQNWGRVPPPRAVEGQPVSCLGGTRCSVGTSVIWALVENVGTLPVMGRENPISGIHERGKYQGTGRGRSIP
jgi:uncharacterized protein YjhX (UPF0386 family)